MSTAARDLRGSTVASGAALQISSRQTSLFAKTHKSLKNQTLGHVQAIHEHEIFSFEQEDVTCCSAVRAPTSVSCGGRAPGRTASAALRSLPIFSRIAALALAVGWEWAPVPGSALILVCSAGGWSQARHAGPERIFCNQQARKQNIEQVVPCFGFHLEASACIQLF